MNWLPLILLTLLALVFPLIILFRKPAGIANNDNQESNETNVSLYKERLTEIELQTKAGEITEDQAQQLITEQQRLLLQDSSEKGSEQITSAAQSTQGRSLIAALLLLLPIFAFALYKQLGASADMEIMSLMGQRANHVETAEGELQIRHQLIEKVIGKLQTSPKNPAYRVMLARLYMQGNDIPRAVTQYKKALTIVPEQSEIQAEYAQALFFSAQGQFNATIDQAINSALRLDPGNVTALGLRGLKAYTIKDYATAIASWEMALRRMHPQSPQAMDLHSGIQNARKALGDELPGITVELSMAAELNADPEQTVFLFARQWQGPPMPLAVARLKVSELPASIRLDDTKSMPGGTPLSSANAIELVARVSATGTVTPSSGDLQGISPKIPLEEGMPSEPLQLIIDSRLP